MENLNSKWQKYDQSREEYVRGLCQKLKEVEGVMLYKQEINRLNGLLEEMQERKRLSRERDDRIQMLEQQVIRNMCSLHTGTALCLNTRSKVLFSGSLAIYKLYVMYTVNIKHL